MQIDTQIFENKASLPEQIRVGPEAVESVFARTAQWSSTYNHLKELTSKKASEFKSTSLSEAEIERIKSMSLEELVAFRDGMNASIQGQDKLLTSIVEQINQVSGLENASNFIEKYFDNLSRLYLDGLSCDIAADEIQTKERVAFEIELERVGATRETIYDRSREIRKEIKELKKPFWKAWGKRTEIEERQKLLESVDALTYSNYRYDSHWKNRTVDEWRVKRNLEALGEAVTNLIVRERDVLDDQLQIQLKHYRSQAVDGASFHDKPITAEFIAQVISIPNISSFLYSARNSESKFDESLKFVIEKLDERLEGWRDESHPDKKDLYEQAAKIYSEIMAELALQCSEDPVFDLISSDHLLSLNTLRVCYVRASNEVMNSKELLLLMRTEDLLQTTVSLDSLNSYQRYRQRFSFDEERSRQSFNKVIAAYRTFNEGEKRESNGLNSLGDDFLIALTLDSERKFEANQLRREEYYRTTLQGRDITRSHAYCLDGALTETDWILRHGLIRCGMSIDPSKDSIQTDSRLSPLSKAISLLSKDQPFEISEQARWDALLYIRKHGSDLEKRMATSLCRDLAPTVSAANYLLAETNHENYQENRGILVSSIIKAPESGIESLRAILANRSDISSEEKNFFSRVLLATVKEVSRYNAEGNLYHELSFTDADLQLLGSFIGINKEDAILLANGIATIKGLNLGGQHSKDQINELVYTFTAPENIDSLIAIGKKSDHFGAVYERVRTAVHASSYSLQEVFFLANNPDLVEDHLKNFQEVQALCGGFSTYSSIRTAPQEELCREMSKTSGSFLFAAIQVDGLTDQDLEQIARHSDKVEAKDAKLILEDLKTNILSQTPSGELLKSLLKTRYWTRYLANDITKITELKNIVSSALEASGGQPRLAHDTMGVLTTMFAARPELHETLREDSFPLFVGLVKSAGGRLFTPDLNPNLDRQSEATEVQELCEWFIEAESSGNLPSRLKTLIATDPELGATIAPGLYRLPKELYSDETIEALENFIKKAPTSRNSFVLNKGLKIGVAQLNWVSTQDDISSALAALGQLADAGFGTQEGFTGLDKFGAILRDEQLSLSSSEIETVIDFFRDFGVSPYPTLVKVYRELWAGGNANGTLVGDSVTFGGKQGIAQLKARMKVLMGALINNGQIPNPSPVELEVMAAITRYHDSTWRNGVDFKTFLLRFEELRTQGHIAETPTFMAPGSFTVARLDERSVANFSITQDASMKIAECLKDVLWCEERSADRVFAEAKAEVIFELKEIGKLLTEKSTQLSGEKERVAVAKTLQSLESLIKNIEQSTTATQLIGLIANRKSSKREMAAITGPMRRLCFKEALESNNSEPEIINIAKGNVNVATLGPVLEFIEHHVIEEGLKKVLINGSPLSDKAMQELRTFLPTNIFRDELKRFQSIAASELEEINVIPNRTILGEASGQVCDACWSRQSDILRNNPSIVPVIFGKNVDGVDAKLLGATLLIPVEVEATGEKMILIRGLNPLQNVITKMNVGSFVEGFMDYIESWAKESGFTGILIVGDGSGQAQTNRPDISLYLHSRFVIGKNSTPLVDTPALQFNGYQVAERCFLARQLASTNQAIDN